jgi:hypothetical protein
MEASSSSSQIPLRVEALKSEPSASNFSIAVEKFALTRVIGRRSGDLKYGPLAKATLWDLGLTPNNGPVEGADADEAGPVADEPGQVAQVREVGRGQAVRGGQAGEIDAVGRAEELLEAVGGHLSGLGQEREDAAAVVVDDHHDEVDLARPGAQEAVGVVDEGQVADEQGFGAADPSATPTAVDTTPSMPLAPRLAT